MCPNLFDYLEKKEDLIEEFIFVKIDKGEVVFKEGEEGDFMFIILEGEVSIVLHRGEKDITLATLGDGNFFGEMGLFSGGKRSADVKALTDLKLLKVREEDIRRLKEGNPELLAEFLYGVCAELCDRLYKTDASVESYYFINRALLGNPRFRDFVKKIWDKKEE